MTSKEYRSLLGLLPLKSPSPGDMAKLCPHLTPEEAVKSFTSGDGYVACPPLKVRGGYHVLSYRKESINTVKVDDQTNDHKTGTVTGLKNIPATITWAFSNRTPTSYSDGKLRGNVSSTHLHMDKAMQFAEDNWGDELIIDDWESVVDFYVQDPSDLVNDRYHIDYPRTKAVLKVAFNRDCNEMANDHSKPESHHQDEAISQMSLNSFISSEIKGGRGGYVHFNCAYCGSGLSLTHCNGCGHRFRDDRLRSGWQTPLSKKMVDFLRGNGLVFKIDPREAQRKELYQFTSKSQL